MAIRVARNALLQQPGAVNTNWEATLSDHSASEKCVLANQTLLELSFPPDFSPLSSCDDKQAHSRSCNVCRRAATVQMGQGFRSRGWSAPSARVLVTYLDGNNTTARRCRCKNARHHHSCYMCLVALSSTAAIRYLPAPLRAQGSLSSTIPPYFPMCRPTLGELEAVWFPAC